MQLSEKQWCKQLDATQASAQEAQQQLERRLQQQEWQLEQQSKRAEESEQQCRSLQQQVLQLQQSLREAQLASEVGGCVDTTRAGHVRRPYAATAATDLSFPRPQSANIGTTIQQLLVLQ